MSLHKWQWFLTHHRICQIKKCFKPVQSWIWKTISPKLYSLLTFLKYSPHYILLFHISENWRGVLYSLLTCIIASFMSLYAGYVTENVLSWLINSILVVSWWGMCRNDWVSGVCGAWRAVLALASSAERGVEWPSVSSRSICLLNPPTSCLETRTTTIPAVMCIQVYHIDILEILNKYHLVKPSRVAKQFSLISM